jgi:hypothetical protein
VAIDRPGISGHQQYAPYEITRFSSYTYNLRHNFRHLTLVLHFTFQTNRQADLQIEAGPFAAHLRQGSNGIAHGSEHHESENF